MAIKLELKKPKEELLYIKNLYEEAFPRAEKKPFFFIEIKARKGKAEILSINSDKPLGLVITAFYKDLVLIDYFAIDSALRGNGIGSEAISLIKERYHGKKIFLEIERPDENADNCVQRAKRKSFYLKNGFSETNVFVRAFGVDMELLAYGAEVTYRDYHSVYKNAFGSFTALAIKEIKKI